MALRSRARVARRLHVRGVVQGVGFRPYVYRLALRHRLHGWVLNGEDGVRAHVEGAEPDVEAFIRELVANPPAAAQIAAVDISVCDVDPSAEQFEIARSLPAARPTTRLSPDLALCDDCLKELFDQREVRASYPYINCTNCGPRYSIVRALPYDRAHTTMAAWPLCASCA